LTEQFDVIVVERRQLDPRTEQQLRTVVGMWNRERRAPAETPGGYG
jgi:hypothetical protein